MTIMNMVGGGEEPKLIEGTKAFEIYTSISSALSSSSTYLGGYKACPSKRTVTVSVHSVSVGDIYHNITSTKSDVAGTPTDGSHSYSIVDSATTMLNNIKEKTRTLDMSALYTWLKTMGYSSGAKFRCYFDVNTPNTNTYNGDAVMYDANVFYIDYTMTNSGLSPGTPSSGGTITKSRVCAWSTAKSVSTYAMLSLVQYIK